MDSDLTDKPKNEWERLKKSFSYAASGFLHVVKYEKNMHIHLMVALVVVIAGIVLSISRTDWVLLLLTMAMMLSLEIMNTAIERVVDLVTKEHHPLAKIAKDVAAAAVFIFSIFSVVIGFVIFLKPLIELISHLKG